MITDFCEIFKNLVRGKYEKRKNSTTVTKGLQGGSKIKQLFWNLLSIYSNFFKATELYTD